MTADPEAAYYQAVEEFFVSRRGDPLFLSNADWLLIRSWRKQGIPLRIVLRGIENALDAHARSWGRARKVGSLRYCEGEVEAARERWEQALQAGGEAESDVAARILGVARALEEASSLGPESRARARRIALDLRASPPRPKALRETEERLATAEKDLVEAIRREDARVAEVEAEVDATLLPYRGRMPPRVFADLRAQSVTRQLLAAHGLPRLSLFDL